MNWREINQLCPHFLKETEIVFIEETKGFILCHSDTQLLWQTISICPVFLYQRFRHLQLLCIFGKCKDPVDFQCIFQYSGQLLQAFPQIRNLLRKHKTQMTALDHTVLYLWHISKNLHLKLFFHQLLHSGIKHGRHLVKDHAFDMAFLFVLHKTFDISCQGNTHSSAVYHKDDRSICGICQVIGACFRGYSTHAVIIAHNTFHHCNIAVCCIFSKQVSGSLGICKKGVQITGFRPDDSGMKHGIYIIRSAFKRCHFHFSIDQCLQKSAGNQSFATTAGSCRKKYSWNIHPCSPLFLSYIFSTISGHSNLLTVNLYFLNC